MPTDRFRQPAVLALHLEDASTGQPLRPNGRPLTGLAREPQPGARELMRIRDPARRIVHGVPPGTPAA